jgi:hypothetical protein
MLNVIMLIDIMLSVVAPFKILRYTFAQDWGSTKTNWRELKTCLGRVFNYKLGCFDDVHVFISVEARPQLQLKTRPRFSPVG